MPLARIFTRYPERTTALGEQLQHQGYTVEVVNPDASDLAPADLEIEFELCERADVLDRAADLATRLEADVAVAPGVLQPAPQLEAEHASEITGEPILSPAAPENQIDQIQMNRQTDAERDFEAAFAAPSEPVMVEPALLSEVIDVPVMEGSALPPVEFLPEPAAMSAAARGSAIEPTADIVETSRQPDPVPYLAQLTPFSARPTPAEENVRARNEKLAGDLDTGWLPRPERVPAPVGPSVVQRGANGAAKALAGAKTIAATTAEAFREHLQEYKKRAQVRSAESRAAREARLLDLEQRRAEAQQRAVELEAARELAAARLVELVRQREPGLPVESRQEEQAENVHAKLRREEQAAPPAPAAVTQPSAVGSLRHASIWTMRSTPRRPMSPQLRAVLTGAVAVTVLFVVGIVMGVFFPRTPLASSASRPSNGVTVKTGQPAVPSGVTVTTGAPAAAQKPASAASSAPVAAQTARTENKPSPRVGQSRHVAALPSEQAMGDDVVIRHFSRPIPTQKPRQAGQQAGLKHFSDLEN
ncbi:MAG TPA: hypothetical protein VFT65_16550 [Candidatus Angelobacter sp.]|nr:hypothetical protein [Candidatus Angelobacter sp.]